MSWVERPLPEPRFMRREDLVFRREVEWDTDETRRYLIEIRVPQRTPPRVEIYSRMSDGNLLREDSWPLSLLRPLLEFVSDVAPEAARTMDRLPRASVFDSSGVIGMASAFDIERGEAEWAPALNYPTDDEGREYQELEGIVQAMGVNNAGWAHAWIRERVFLQNRTDEPSLGVFRVHIREVDAARLGLAYRARFRVYRDGTEGLLVTYWGGDWTQGEEGS